MTPQEQSEFSGLITNVMSYYRKDASPFMIGLFWQALRHYELADVQRAFEVHVRDPDRGQFAPLVADITRLFEGSTQTQGMRAWSIVEKALRSVGQYQTVVFDDPLVHAVIDDMGGWVSLCCTDTDQLPFRAREFERRYSAFRIRREIPEYPARLLGRAEADNRMRGYQIASPVLIGDPERARHVMERGGSGSLLKITTPRQPGKAVIEHQQDAALV